MAAQLAAQQERTTRGETRDENDETVGEDWQVAVLFVAACVRVPACSLCPPQCARRSVPAAVCPGLSVARPRC